MTWKQGTGFLANRTFAEHTRKRFESSKSKKIVKVVTIIVSISLFFRRSNSVIFAFALITVRWGY